MAPSWYAQNDSSREAVIFESFWRNEPAAELRGLAKVFDPASSWRRLSCSNDDTGMYTSPRTSSTEGNVPRFLGHLSGRGTASMVATLAVTSSPVTPSPRVAACTRRPSSYTSDMASPSIFSSHTNAASAVSGAARAMRSNHAWSSSMPKASSRLIIGDLCWTGENSSDGAPTRRVGESAVTSSGWASSSSRSSPIRAS